MMCDTMKAVSWFLMMINLTIMLIGCQSDVQIAKRPIQEENQISHTPTPVQNVASITLTATVQKTRVEATSTPVASATPQPTEIIVGQTTSTSTPTPIASITPRPTLSPDESIDLVLSLLLDNTNPECLLPCWWGAIPGKTKWAEYRPFIDSFAQSITFFPEQNVFVAIFLVPVEVNYREQLNIGYKVDENGTIVEISAAPENISNYAPTKMMNLYGVPDSVWLTTLSEPREGVLPFQLVIAYQQKGISFRYYVKANRIGENVTACFEPGFVEVDRPDLFPAGPRIYLWEPGKPKTVKEISPIPLEIYYPLEQRTPLTPQTLYEKFSNPDLPPCIDTPAHLWTNH